jgi:hypothetical protein
MAGAALYRGASIIVPNWIALDVSRPSREVAEVAEMAWFFSLGPGPEVLGTVEPQNSDAMFWPRYTCLTATTKVGDQSATVAFLQVARRLIRLPAGAIQSLMGRKIRQDVPTANDARLSFLPRYLGHRRLPKKLKTNGPSGDGNADGMP